MPADPGNGPSLLGPAIPDDAARRANRRQFVKDLQNVARRREYSP